MKETKLLLEIALEIAMKTVINNFVYTLAEKVICMDFEALSVLD